MNAFEAIAADILAIDAETERIAKEEGFEDRHTCTGKVLIDPANEAVWYQMADEYNTTTWVSRSYPQNAAWNETLVCVDDEKEALSYADDYNL
jgi:hypothetical protein